LALNVRAIYTWAHSLDNTSSTFTDGGSNNDNLGYLDSFNHKLDHGNSDFDQRQRAVATVVWEIPFAKHLTGAAKLIADNWTLLTRSTPRPAHRSPCSTATTPTTPARARAL